MTLSTATENIKRVIEKQEIIDKSFINSIRENIKKHIYLNENMSRTDSAAVYILFRYVYSMIYKLEVHEMYLNKLISVSSSNESIDSEKNKLIYSKSFVIDIEYFTNNFFLTVNPNSTSEYFDYMDNAINLMTDTITVSRHYANYAINKGYYYSRLKQSLLDIVMWDFSTKRDFMWLEYFSDSLKKLLTLIAVHYRERKKIEENEYISLIKQIKNEFSLDNETELVHENVFFATMIIAECIEAEAYRARQTENSRYQLEELHKLCVNILYGGSVND